MGRERMALRVFADNGHWWLLNMADDALYQVVVCRRDGDRLVPVEALCFDELGPTEQHSMEVPPSWSRRERIGVEVSWRDHRGESASQRLHLRTDGMRETTPPGLARS